MYHSHIIPLTLLILNIDINMLKQTPSNLRRSTHVCIVLENNPIASRYVSSEVQCCHWRRSIYCRALCDEKRERIDHFRTLCRWKHYDIMDTLSALLALCGGNHCWCACVIFVFIDYSFKFICICIYKRPVLLCSLTVFVDMFQENKLMRNLRLCPLIKI